MGIDTIKVVYTYSIVAIVVIGGFLFLWASRHDTDIQDLRILIGGFMGACITWVVGAETANRTAALANKSQNTGVANVLSGQASASTASDTTAAGS